jgi:hypothetical protein
MVWPASTHKGWPKKAAKSSAVVSGASAAPVAQPAPVAPGAAPVGNVAVKKHIKKQHIKHNKGMKSSPTMTGAAPASSIPTMPNPYAKQVA